MGYDDDVRILKRELLGLFDHIQRIRQEIAAIRKPGSSDDRFVSMSDQLDAIVENTEAATNTIMENAESIDEIILAVRPSVEDAALGGRLDEVPELISGIFEACSFQDITGQRITKVVKSLQYIERRVNSLISIWGEEGLTTVDPPVDTVAPPNAESGLLNGPQLKGHGVSQTEVDALLGTDTAGAPAASISTPTVPGGGQAGGTASQNDIDAMFDSPPAPVTAAPAAEPAPKPAVEPAAKPAAEPPVKPAAKPAGDDSKDADAGGMGQDDIDKLFG